MTHAVYRIIFINFVLLLFLCVSMIANAQNKMDWTPNNMMLVNSITDVTTSPNGKQAAYTVLRYVKSGNNWVIKNEIHITDLQTMHSRLLPFAGDNNHSPTWSPDNHWIAFLADTKNSTTNLVIVDNITGKIAKIIPNDASVSKFAWSPDSQRLAFIKKNPTLLQPNMPEIVGQNKNCNSLWWISLVDKKPVLLTNECAMNCSFISSLQWAPDNKTILFAHFPGEFHDVWNHDEITQVDTQTKEFNTLFKTTEKPSSTTKESARHNPLFSHDGRWIAFTSTTRVYVSSTLDNKARALAATYDEAPELIGWSPDDKFVLVLEKYHTASHIIKLPVNGDAASVIGPTNKYLQAVQINNALLSFTMEDSAEPVEAFVMSLNSDAPRQISQVNANLPLKPVAKTEKINWQSHGLSIEGLLTYPYNYQKDKRYPLLVELHGGPSDVFSQRFIGHPSVYPAAVFSSKGYFYFCLNVRGSTGYGEKFRNANFKDWAGLDYQDVLAGINHVIRTGFVDPQRIGILGWSYGGYLTAWAVSHSNLFKAATLGGGIVDLISYTGTNDLPNFVPANLGGFFWQNPKLYLERSPIFYVQKVKTPTLLQYGAEDVRVPPSQGYEFYNALKLLHIPTELILYPNTEHAIRQPNLMAAAAKANVEWFERYL